MSIGVLQMPLQLSTSEVYSSTSEDMVGGGFSKSGTPILDLSAADKALRSGSSSRAPRARKKQVHGLMETQLRGCHAWGQTPIHARRSGCQCPRTATRLPQFMFLQCRGLGSSNTQSGSDSNDWADAGQCIWP